MHQTSRLISFAALLASLSFTASADTRGTCPEEPALKNWSGGGTVTCPCFIAGEEAGSVLNIPSQHLPAEILRIGIGWGSAFGGSPDSLEQSIHVYNAGLPDPGTPIFSLDGPVLTDGFINEFDIEPLPGTVTISSNPITVTLEFFNDSAPPFGASMVHDGAGCIGGGNVVKAIPGGWADACLLGVTGNWVVSVIYRPLNCGGGNQTYCVTSANSAGSGAIMGLLGSTSVSANDLIVTCVGGPPQKVGLFFYGPNQIQVPFGDGFRCVGGQINRMPPPVQIDVFGNAAYVVDNTLPRFSSGSGALTAGANWNFQFWYRDPAFGGSGFNLSNGLALTFTP